MSKTEIFNTLRKLRKGGFSENQARKILMMLTASKGGEAGVRW